MSEPPKTTGATSSSCSWHLPSNSRLVNAVIDIKSSVLTSLHVASSKMCWEHIPSGDIIIIIIMTVSECHLIIIIIIIVLILKWPLAQRVLYFLITCHFFALFLSFT